MSDSTESMNFEFNLRTNAKFGAGKATQLSRFLKELSLSRPGVIVDGGIAGLPYTKKVIEGLVNDPDLCVKVWTYDLNHEPDYDSLDRIKRHFTDAWKKPLWVLLYRDWRGKRYRFCQGAVNGSGEPWAMPWSIRDSRQASIHRFPPLLFPQLQVPAGEVTYNAVFTDNSKMKNSG